MKCFNHRELHAIAVCKHCGKALCSSCTANVEGVLACKDICETAAVDYVRLFKRSAQNLKMQPTIYRSLAYFLYGVSALSVGIGGYMAYINEFRAPEALLFGWGGLSGILGYVTQRQARSLQ